MKGQLTFTDGAVDVLLTQKKKLGNTDLEVCFLKKAEVIDASGAFWFWSHERH